MKFNLDIYTYFIYFFFFFKNVINVVDLLWKSVYGTIIQVRKFLVKNPLINKN
jgi:hypothetical protein